MSQSVELPIRCAGAGDVAALRDLIRRTVEESYAPVYPPRAIAFFKAFHSEERVAERIRTGAVLTVDARGAPVATGSLFDAEILAVFVDPRFHGRGLGRRIMNALEEQARTDGLREIKLSVSLPARGFYEGLGYRLGPMRSTDVGEGQRLDFWEGIKAL